MVSSWLPASARMAAQTGSVAAQDCASAAMVPSEVPVVVADWAASPEAVAAVSPSAETPAARPSSPSASEPAPVASSVAPPADCCAPVASCETPP